MKNSNFLLKVLNKETKNIKLNFNEIPKKVVSLAKILQDSNLERHLFFFGFNSTGEYLFSYISEQITVINIWYYKEPLLENIFSFSILQKITYLEIIESRNKDFMLFYMFHQDRNIIHMIPYPQLDKIEPRLLTLLYFTKSYSLKGNDCMINQNNVNSICFTTDSTIEVLIFSLKNDLPEEKDHSLKYKYFPLKEGFSSQENVSVDPGEIKSWKSFHLNVEEFLSERLNDIKNYDAMIIGNDHDCFIAIITCKTQNSSHVYYCMISISERVVYITLETNENKEMKELVKEAKSKFFLPRKEVFTLNNMNLYRGQSLPFLIHPTIPLAFSKE